MVHAVAAVHAVPAELQVSGVFPLQRFCPVTQGPVQRPPLQVAAHVCERSHAVPELLHVSTPLPLQRTAPAEQVVVAVHVPLLHAWGQVCVAIQLPPALQFSMVVPLHRFCPGVQADDVWQLVPGSAHAWPETQFFGSDQSVQPDESVTQSCC